MDDLQAKENAICDVIKNNANVCIVDDKNSIFTDGIRKYFTSKYLFTAEEIKDLKFLGGENLILQGHDNHGREGYFVYLVVDKEVE